MWIKAGVISFLTVLLIEPFLIPFLRRLKFGQTILEDGPKWHEKKQGTPTMGGIAFIVSVALGSAFFLESARGFSVLLCGIGFGLIGFIDDYIKVIKKHNQGLTPKQKFLLQTLVSLIYVVYLYVSYGKTETLIPFTNIHINLGILYIPFAMLVLIATSNSSNLTDGLDGLCASVGSVVSIFFAIACIKLPEFFEGSIIASALAGGLLCFLIFNAHPAKVFMGDTGSLFIGGMIGAISINAGLELFILISAFVFLFEALSVIIQVAVYKKTKKRVFKMAPVHHHFEMCGWKETKVVMVFSLVTVVLCVVSYLALIKVI